MARPDLTVLAIPAYIGAMGFEFWWQRQHPAADGEDRPGDYELNDTIASLSMGIGSLVAPFVTGPTQALRAAKEAVDKGLEVSLDTGLEIEAQLFTGLFATNDQKTGMRSFVDNGPGKATFEGI